MSRARQTFKQTDLVKALKALAKVGMSGRVEISPDGRIIVVAGAPDQEQNSVSEETSADLRKLL